MRIALIQLETSSSIKAKDRYLHLLELMPVKDSCELVILPELWLLGAFEFSKFTPSALKGIEEINNKISEIARKRKYWVHAGSNLIRSGTKIYNESIVFDSDGKVAGKYRKQYIFGFSSGESKIVSPGNKFEIIKSPWGNIALSICYDLRFPEQYRKMVFKGAEIYLVVAAWPEQRIDHWKKLIAARAIENQGFFIGCNGIGTQTDATLGGHSIVVNPNGDVVSEFSNSEEVQIIEINHKMVLETRATFPVLQDIK